jgi:diguanylate cyclase (GGDEF)-like protein
LSWHHPGPIDRAGGGITLTGLRKTLTAALRTRSRDFYAAADLGTAKRLGGFMWAGAIVLILVLLPVAPPTASPLGRWGWALTAVGIGFSGRLAYRLLRRPAEVRPGELIQASYAALGMLGVLVWMTGPRSPFVEVFLVSVLYTAAVHPPRRVLVYLVGLVAAVCAPLVYDGWDPALAADTAGRLGVWCGLGLVAMAFTARVRMQRIGLMRERTQASELAREDALTGLGNRRAFDEALGSAFQRAGRSGEDLSLIVGDLDGFKQINDRWGHLTGDQCLCAVAMALAGVVRAPDACFRWGGDEFAVLADSDLAGADILRGRVMTAVADQCTTPDGQPLSIRLGAAQLEPGMTPAELVDRADLDLLEAKGRVGA